MARGRLPHTAVPVHSMRGMVDRCTVRFLEQPFDHLDPSNNGTFLQRYFVHDDSYNNKDGPIFFYLGNEADVTLYVNATGLMWENAPQFGALLIFAEHRYYGKSVLFPNESLSKSNNLRYLSVEQALLDYVVLIDHVKEMYQVGERAAVIGFGGSYGGMLASWGRFHFPHVWDGVIAASAPILSFEGMLLFNAEDFFARGVTYDVTPAAGANTYCEPHLRRAFANLSLLEVEPNVLRDAFSICPTDNTTDDNLGWALTFWIKDALEYMSMGNFPYASTYILNGNGQLPAFPVRVACEFLNTSNETLDEWLAGLAGFASVYYNYTGRLPCNTLSAPVNPESNVVNTLWNYQYCSQIFQVFGQVSDEDDMFWDSPWNGTATAQDCYDQLGFWPNRNHFVQSYGTPKDWSRDASNIVWSQGEYDPWCYGGVAESLSGSLVAMVIPQAAHHLDLFFPHENDTTAVIDARTIEMDHVKRWIEEKRTKLGGIMNRLGLLDEGS